MKSIKHTVQSILLIIVVIAAAQGVVAQSTISPDKRLAEIEAMPRQQARNALDQWLNSAEQDGSKAYKRLIASLEEMLSEPTWSYHNEELLALVIEHATNASCLNENEKQRPKMMLEVVNKNAPGAIAHEIEYETLDGTKGKISDNNTPLTLIYFNDPECLSCAKVKERLDTCTTLKNMVADSTLTIIGIYPYDNIEEWKLEPFPSYIINGIDLKHEIDEQQTYDLMTMPLFYLLDNKKRVILKNEASLNKVIKALTKLKGLKNSNIEQKLDAVF